MIATKFLIPGGATNSQNNPYISIWPLDHKCNFCFMGLLSYPILRIERYGNGPMNSVDDPYFSTLVGPRTHCFQFVKISLLSKVNSGRKVVHWMRTLSQDSCSLYEPMYPTHLSPLLLSCPYLFIGLGNWVGVTKKMQITGELMPNFFFVLDLVFLSPLFDQG